MLSVGNIYIHSKIFYYLNSLGLFGLEQSRLRGGLMVACSSLTREAEGQALSSALWGQRQDLREHHGAGTGEGQADSMIL